MRENYLLPVATQAIAPPAADQPQILVVPSLLMVEGEQTSSSGKTINYTESLLQKIVDGSNALLAKGEEIPFIVDHDYSQDNKIGLVIGPFSLATITQENLPHPGMTDLIGKLGIFSPVQISGAENITKYLDKRIKRVSVGIDLATNEIFELSAVLFPAVRGATLYSDGTPVESEQSGDSGVVTAGKALATAAVAGGDRHYYAKKDAPNYVKAEGDTNCENCGHYKDGSCDEYGFKPGKDMTCDDYMKPGKSDDEEKNSATRQAIQQFIQAAQGGDLPQVLAYALSLQEELKDRIQEQAERQLYMLFGAFIDVLESIREASAETLAGRSPEDLRRAALDELIAQLRGRLNIPAPTTAPPTVPLYSQNTMQTEFTADSTNAAANPAAQDSSIPVDYRLQTQAQAAEIATLKQQMAQMQSDRDLARTYSGHLRRGESLRSAGILTPAAFRDIFGDGSSDTALQTYSQARQKDPIDFLLGHLEKFGQPIISSNPLAAEPLDSNPLLRTNDQVQADAEATYARLQATGLLPSLPGRP